MYSFYDHLYNGSNPYYSQQTSKKLTKAAQGLNIPRCPRGWVWDESLQKCVQDKEARKALAQKVVDVARQHVNDDSYFPVPESIKNTQDAMDHGANGCIGGVCSVLTEAGAMDAPNWSNTDFAAKAKDYGFPNKGYGLSGIKNLEPGDILQMVNDYNDQGNVYPGHSMIFLGVNDDGDYEFFDNYNGPRYHTTTKWSKRRVEEELNPSNNNPKITHSVIYKMNPYDPPPYNGDDPKVTAALEERKKNLKDNLHNNLSYQYGANEQVPKGYGKNDNTQTFGNYNTIDNIETVRNSPLSDVNEYGDNFPNEPDLEHNTYYRSGWKTDALKSFFDMANNPEAIDNLVSQTGASKEDIHDSLLNVFGELGQESNWGDPEGGKSKAEYKYEKFLSTTGLGHLLGGGKKLSVGPGQIKLKYIDEDLKDKFDIHTTKDLFNTDKVAQLMVAQDLKAKGILKKWSDDGTLGKKLGIKINGEEPTVETLPGGVGRWSPYLRNSLYNISTGKRGANNSFTKIGKFFGMQDIGNKSNIDPTTGDLIEPWKLDAGSYPSKVANMTNKYLTRRATTPGTILGVNEQNPTESNTQYINSPEGNEYGENLEDYNNLMPEIQVIGGTGNTSNIWEQRSNNIIHQLNPVVVQSHRRAPVTGGIRYAEPPVEATGNNLINQQNINPLNTNKMGGSINYMAAGGGAQDAQQQQLMQIIQMYAQMKGKDPRQVIQELKQLDPAAQKQALQQIVSEVQQGAQGQQQGQQQMAPQQQAPEQAPMQRMGGQPCYNCGGMYAYGGVSGQNPNPGTYEDGYSGTNAGNNYFNHGGAFVPSYADSAYGGMMYGGGMAEGGVVVGGVYNADQSMLQKLQAGGYTYEIVND
jgi:hypothetical protein